MMKEIFAGSYKEPTTKKYQSLNLYKEHKRITLNMKQEWLNELGRWI
jgi:hypothetical protein